MLYLVIYINFYKLKDTSNFSNDAFLFIYLFLITIKSDHLFCQKSNPNLVLPKKI